MLLTELLTPDRIRIPLVSTAKEDVLRELVDVLNAACPLDDKADVLRAVMEREAVLSTGIGNGLAIPHGKSPSVPALALAAGTARPGIDFDALDGEPVTLFFLLVGPQSAAGDHVKALSRVSRLLRRDAVRTRLSEASTPEEFYRLLGEAEAS